MDRTLSHGTAIRVVIVDDDRILCQEMERLLGAVREIAVAGVFHDAQSALAALVDAGLPADVALIDLDLGASSGIQLVRRLARVRPEIVCVAFTVSNDDRSVFDVLRAGACGYLLKGLDGAKLVDSLLEVTRGGSPMSPGVARRVLGWLRTARVQEPSPRAEVKLTSRETEVLELLARGHTYGAISRELRIGVGTVQCYVKAIYRKLGVTSKAEAAADAYRRGLLD